MTIELNMFNLQKQPRGFDDVEHSTFNWVGDSSLEEVGFDHEEEYIWCVYESFYVKCELEYDTFVFDDQCDDLFIHPFLHPFPLLSFNIIRYFLVWLHLHLLN